MENINVLSNSCAHLGCPVRWLVQRGRGRVPLPVPRRHLRHQRRVGRRTAPAGDVPLHPGKVEEDGTLYVKHEYDIQDRLDAQQPYVV